MGTQGHQGTHSTPVQLLKKKGRATTIFLFYLNVRTTSSRRQQHIKIHGSAENEVHRGTKPQTP
jgi:hypothetical protein